MAATDLQVSLEVLLLVCVGRSQAEDVVVPGPRGLDVQLLLLDRQVTGFLLQRLARREQRNDVLLPALRPEINTFNQSINGVFDHKLWPRKTRIAKGLLIQCNLKRFYSGLYFYFFYLDFSGRFQRSNKGKLLYLDC